MKEKIEYLLRKGNYTATSFARLLDIQPSGVSHILSGRNKPSFDLVVKILRAFPDVNPDWLLLDSEQIYRTATPSVNIQEQQDNVTSSHSLPAGTEKTQISTACESSKNDTEFIFSNPQNGTKRIEKVIVLYNDKSFESYNLK